MSSFLFKAMISDRIDKVSGVIQSGRGRLFCLFKVFLYSYRHSRALFGLFSPEIICMMLNLTFEIIREIFAFLPPSRGPRRLAV